MSSNTSDGNRRIGAINPSSAGSSNWKRDCEAALLAGDAVEDDETARKGQLVPYLSLAREACLRSCKAVV